MAGVRQITAEERAKIKGRGQEAGGSSLLLCPLSLMTMDYGLMTNVTTVVMRTTKYEKRSKFNKAQTV
ncbi:hypothetical protein NSMS1_57510 [Nostoc sp. MS1]|nr:hypothetical protein NSMS1_57510 [Nostoc sp. MS1]